MEISIPKNRTARKPMNGVKVIKKIIDHRRCLDMEIVAYWLTLFPLLLSITIVRFEEISFFVCGTLTIRHPIGDPFRKFIVQSEPPYLQCVVSGKYPVTSKDVKVRLTLV
jgi:hypothetical protein